MRDSSIYDTTLCCRVVIGAFIQQPGQEDVTGLLKIYYMGVVDVLGVLHTCYRGVTKVL